MDRSGLVEGLSRFFSGIDPQQTLQGWGNVRWGQNLERVQRQYPQATVKNSGLSLAAEDPTQRHWSLDFGFDQNQQLNSVTLTFAGGREGADFAEISQELTRRLGPPVQTSQSGNVWKRDETQVSLSLEPEGGIVLSEIV